VDERDAVARLQRGDIGGLETLVRLYQVRAVRAAYLITRDPALADDQLQESYIRFLSAEAPPVSAADGEIAARRYLFRIATNLLRDHWRKPKSTAIEDVPEHHFSAPDTSGQSDTRALLGPALLLLTPRERQLLWLAYAEGYSHREIAAITGLASASIRLLLFRARRKAARLLQPNICPEGTA